MKLIRSGQPGGSVGIKPILITPSNVKSTVGVCKNTMLKLEKTDPNCPARVRITTGLTGWVYEELENYVKNMERVENKEGP